MVNIFTMVVLAVFALGAHAAGTVTAEQECERRLIEHVKSSLDGYFSIDNLNDEISARKSALLLYRIDLRNYAGSVRQLLTVNFSHSLRLIESFQIIGSSLYMIAEGSDAQHREFGRGLREQYPALTIFFQVLDSEVRAMEKFSLAVRAGLFRINLSTDDPNQVLRAALIRANQSDEGFVAYDQFSNQTFYVFTNRQILNVLENKELLRTLYVRFERLRDDESIKSAMSVAAEKFRNEDATIVQYRHLFFASREGFESLKMIQNMGQLVSSRPQRSTVVRQELLDAIIQCLPSGRCEVIQSPVAEPAISPETKPETKVETKAEPRVEPKVEPKPETKMDLPAPQIEAPPIAAPIKPQLSPAPVETKLAKVAPEPPKPIRADPKPTTPPQPSPKPSGRGWVNLSNFFSGSKAEKAPEPLKPVREKPVEKPKAATPAPSTPPVARVAPSLEPLPQQAYFSSTLIARLKEISFELRAQERSDNYGAWVQDPENRRKFRLAQFFAKIEPVLSEYDLQDTEREKLGSDRELYEVLVSERKESIEKLRLAQLELLEISKDKPSQGAAIVEIGAESGQISEERDVIMIRDMYINLAKKLNWAVEIVDESFKDRQLRYLILRIAGNGVFDLMRFERGTHRIIFHDGKSREHRHSLEVRVMPEIPEIETDKNYDDLEFSTAKSGGPGGQHVNKTESSVRVTHKPTGQVVRVSSQRSQHQNKRIAISMIFERIREEAELARIKQIQGLRNQRSTESYVRVYDLREKSLELEETLKGNGLKNQLQEKTDRDSFDRLINGDKHNRSGSGPATVNPS